MNTSENHGIDHIFIERSDFNELHLSGVHNAKHSLKNIFQRMASICKEQNAQVIKMDIFGSLDASQTFSAWIKETFGKIDWPVTFVAGEQWSGEQVGGIYTYAISGTEVQSIHLQDHCIARSFEDNHARYLIMGNVHPRGNSLSPRESTRQTLREMETVLKRSGMEFTDMVRTWFFNHRILDWYDEFNESRTTFYTQKNILNGLLPASTGMGGSNIYGTCILASALAICPKNDGISIKNVSSPLQDSACKYGSSFSRAVEIATPHHRQILVSGTASINTSGDTVHRNDLDAQIDQTMNVVEAILHSRDMTSAHINRVYAYTKYAKDIPSISRLWKNWKIPCTRVLFCPNDICREDLLFEIEVDAISVKEK